jgi:tRNA A-37 threonylcarbamoyl transferase component Bud32
MQNTKVFRKTYKDPSPGQVRKSAELQRIAADLLLAPRIISTDNETYIDMELIDEMCIADKWGEDLDELDNVLAESIRYGIWHILFTLHHIGMEYLDVTPYNFIEKDGRVWVIDFDDVKLLDKGAQTTNPYLKPIVEANKKVYWNPIFK